MQLGFKVMGGETVWRALSCKFRTKVTEIFTWRVFFLYSAPKEVRPRKGRGAPVASSHTGMLPARDRNELERQRWPGSNSTSGRRSTPPRMPSGIRVRLLEVSSCNWHAIWTANFTEPLINLQFTSFFFQSNNQLKTKQKKLFTHSAEPCAGTQSNLLLLMRYV